MLTKQVQMDASVGFATSKGAALMAPAQRNLGKATVNGIWAHQGSKPFVDQGRLYSSMGDNARSVDPATGKVIWSRKLRAGRSESDLDALLTPPAIVNGKLFIASASGEVYALAEKSGDVLWTVRIGEPVSFQPTVANGHVYVATDGGTLYCLNTGDARDHGWLMWGANGAHNGMAGK
jgi:outer membrane protein assembly factor BamB